MLCIGNKNKNVCTKFVKTHNHHFLIDGNSKLKNFNLSQLGIQQVVTHLLVLVLFQNVNR